MLLYDHLLTIFNLLQDGQSVFVIEDEELKTTMSAYVIVLHLYMGHLSIMVSVDVLAFQLAVRVRDGSGCNLALRVVLSHAY